MKKRKCLYAIVCALALLLSACTAETPPETSAPVETKPPVETTAPVETTEPQLKIPEGAYPDGEYTVGTDIPAGEYVFIPYEAERAATAHIKRNGESVYFCETVGQSFATVQQDELLIAKNCYFFSAEGYIAAPNSEGIYGPGMYRVGIDIPRGEYQITQNSAEGIGRWSQLFDSYVNQSFVNASPTSVIKETPDIADLTIQAAYALILGADTYAAPAPPPENATFLFPEAPKETGVKPLPDSYDAAALVSPYWETGVSFGEAIGFYIFLPEIYPFSEDAIVAQQDIYQLFYDELHWLVRHSVEYPVTKMLDTSEVTIFSDFGGAAIKYQGYSACIRDGILSIIVRNDWLHNSAGRSFYTYNFDLTTGKRLYSQDLADRLGVSQDAITQGVTEFYEEMHAVLPDKTVDFYQENLKKTLSEENLSAGQLCIGEDGSVMMVVEIYSIGSLEHVQRLVKISDSESTKQEDENALTQAELDEIKDLFTQHFNEDRSIPAPINYYNRLLWSDFNSPEQVDIRRLFYDQDIDENWELTDAERTYLSQFEYVMLNLSVVRVSTKKMNTVLQQCLGITLEETDRVGMETMAYYPDTDCYYSSKGDMGTCTLQVYSGTRLDDGTIEVKYNFYTLRDKIMVLQETETGYIVLSNRNA